MCRPTLKIILDIKFFSVVPRKCHIESLLYLFRCHSHSFNFLKLDDDPLIHLNTKYCLSPYFFRNL